MPETPNRRNDPNDAFRPAPPLDVPGALRSAAAEIRSATATLTTPPPPGAVPARPRPVLAALAVAAAVVAVALGLTTWLGGPSDRASAPAGRTSATTSAAPRPSQSEGPSPDAVVPFPSTAAEPVASQCGDEIPVRLWLPDGYGGMADGPADQAADPVLPGQYVVHWDGPDGTVEARYPIEPGAQGGAGTSEPVIISYEEGRTPVADVTVRGRTGACEVLGLTWYGTPPQGFGDRVNGFTSSDMPKLVQRQMTALVAVVTRPSDLRLVTSTRNVTTAPTTALKCTGGDVPNRKGTGEGTSGSTPEKALEAFLDSTPEAQTMNSSGWTKLVAADGTITFGVPFDSGPGWVQLVHVVKQGGTWSVDRWTTSGC